MKKECRQKPFAILILSLAVFLVYLGSFVYGLCRYFDQDYSHSQAALIVLQSLGGMVLAFLPMLLEHLFGVRISLLLDAGIQLFGLFGIVFGEACRFYYEVSYWDDVLHFLSGFGVALIAYCLMEAVFKADAIHHRVGLYVTASLLTSFSVAFLWEIYEYTADSLFGLNMQKAIPENALFNGGSIWDALKGSDEEIAAFFRFPSGYLYALTDTMSDMLDCFAGTLLFEIAGSFLRHKKPFIFANEIVFSPKKAFLASPSEGSPAPIPTDGRQ
jgi:hypothetical protein